jgi:hypothetical protein
MAKILSIRYTIVGGSLPNGMKLNPDTGNITGSPGFDALGQGPAWQGPASGSLGSYNEGDAFSSVTLSANTDKTPVIFSLPTTKDVLPWGIQINPTTGVISGTFSPLLLRVKEEGSTSDGPVWNTPFGKLAGYDEDFVASVSLSATPILNRTLKYYELVSGYLPWGLKLNTQTGVISGSVGRLKTPGVFVDVPKLPIPVWVTATNMGTFHEGEAFNTSLVATPDAGRSLVKYTVREGYLPWGLKLNTQNGNIAGTLVDIFKRNEANYYDATKDPVFSNTVSLNGSNTTVGEGGSLGSYAKGASMTATVTAAPTSGRTIRNYSVTIGALPFGLKLNKLTGEVSGTIVNTTMVQSKSYSFTITAYDQGGSFNLVNHASRSYTITVQ